MVRYIGYVSEGEIRDDFYALIVNYLLSNGRSSVVIPELIISGNQRPDLVVYVCNDGYCSLLMLIEFKNDPKVSHHKVQQQALKYAYILNPLYRVIVDLRGPLYLAIFQGENKIHNNNYHSYQDLVNTFRGFLSQAVSKPLSFSVPKPEVINEIHKAPTYERFLRAEFYRIIGNLGKNGTIYNHDYYPIPECTVIDAVRLSAVKPDLVVYSNQATLDCDYPLLVLEFKSSYNPSAASQASTYAKSLLPYYYGEVYGSQHKAQVKIYDRQNRQVVNKTISLGDPYLNEQDIKNILMSLPQSSNPIYSPLTFPLNGVHDISELIQYGVKVVHTPLSRDMRYSLPGFSLLLDKGGIKYPNHDYKIMIDCPAKLTRLTFFDPNNQLQWCEFKNGDLIKCNVPVDAVMSSSPCIKLFDKIFP